MPESITAEFVVEKDTKNTRRYAEDTDGPPAIGMLYVQKWALKQLNGGQLPDRVKVVVTVA